MTSTEHKARKGFRTPGYNGAIPVCGLDDGVVGGAEAGI
jgi:hypothetical protein